MKKTTLFIVAFLGLLLLGALSTLTSDPEEAITNPENEHSFAVVELFTSEGCSSCPPADQLLSTIVDDARANNTPVYALAFHVDYWNYLGWKDIYSKAEYSQRQKEYADKLDSHVYTPQMVVNGKHEFVGSDRYKTENYIDKALNSGRDISLSIDVEQAEDRLSIIYEMDQSPANTELNIAVVERGLSRNIERGENRGKTLRHENVVRAFETLKPDRMRGTQTLSVPDEVDAEKASVIVYLQQSKPGHVIAAQAQNLQPMM